MMNDRYRQEALVRHGLKETRDGFELTAQGFQRASKRTQDLRRQGDQEAARMLALGPSDPARWEFCRCVAIEAFTAEVHHSGI